jgi:hypothetical protein
VPEFYAWFAAFLAAEPGTPPQLAGRGRRGPRGTRQDGGAQPWSANDAEQATWLYRRQRHFRIHPRPVVKLALAAENRLPLRGSEQPKRKPPLGRRTGDEAATADPVAAWPLLSGSSRVATAGETAAQSRMEQSVNVGGPLLLLVLSDHLVGGRRGERVPDDAQDSAADDGSGRRLSQRLGDRPSHDRDLAAC